MSSSNFSFCHQLVPALLCNDRVHGLHSELEVGQLADVTQPVGLELDANISGGRSRHCQDDQDRHLDGDVVLGALQELASPATSHQQDQGQPHCPHC